MKRQEFIRNSSGILLGSMVAPHLMAQLNTNSVVSIGVIGTGGRGQGIVKLLNNIPGFEVVAVCDTLTFRLEEAFDLIKDNKRAKAYSDYRKLLDD